MRVPFADVRLPPQSNIRCELYVDDLIEVGYVSTNNL